MIRRLLLLLTALAILVGATGLLLLWKEREVLQQPLEVTQETLLEVPAGATPNGLFRQLEQDGVIHGAFWLRLHWRFRDEGQTLHTGEYRLVPGQTMAELLGAWQRGDVVQYSLTLVEGWNFRQVRLALSAQPKLEQQTAELTDDALMDRLGLGGTHPEGQFFPDTYRYVRGTSDLELLRQAHRRQQQVFDDEWAQRAEDLPYESPYQALIMASLVEKETGVPEERDQIAGVFVRRLAKGMLLQTDPTVIYGMGDRYDGRIRRADLREDTPYNTYVNSGLPPTPIAMVGREAIHAALHPAEGSSLYFVARGDGSHVFSDSLDAHNRAVRQFQLKRRADYRSSPPPAPAVQETE